MAPRRRTLFESEGASLWYYPAARIVHHELRRFVRGEELRTVLEAGLEMIEQRGACKWLSDNRGNAPLTPADAEWATNHWGRRAVAAGWRYWAIVMPKLVTGQMHMRRRIAMYAEHGVKTETFDDPEQGLRWLEAQKT
jgi:hypothetical protein